MNKINKIDSGSYGICLFSLNNFSKYLKKNKIKSKSLINFFNKNKLLSDDTLEKGIILPINTMSFNQFYFDFITENKKQSYFSANNWTKIAEKGIFNLEINENELWICSMDVLNAWDINKFTQNILGYTTKNGVEGKESFYYEAQKMNFASGKYLVTLHGYKRIKHNEPVNDDEDYGLGFELKKVDGFSINSEIPENINFEIVD
ncbi:hypothetical protein GYM75_06530 [Gilliamella sp. ESL0441]|uniref:hypothetical protein n=1 Tax=Gilliamella sp. ESL0441 TaxID=2704654 RepID=UPI001C69B5BA|nr:hypothetical protein [Gilliamella sp. ESL0441]QYN44520.1 hypothetical protein GYM75_06530 [Gilliamella sp. ESL0441]